MLLAIDKLDGPASASKGINTAAEEKICSLKALPL